MTGTELDEILASENEQETTETVETPQVESQVRDEQGRFAAKALNEPDAPLVETEQNIETEAEPGKVPQKALHAAREKERETKQENEQLRREMAEMRGQMQMIMQQRQPAQQQTEPEKPVDFWEDPDNYLKRQLSPVQQQLSQQKEQFSKMLAMQAHGKETVDGAFQAFSQAMQANPQALAGEYQSMMRSEHPYDALVSWHKRQQTLQTVGNDPNAWLEAEMERRLSDPAYQAKVLEKIKGTAAANVSRSNPVTSLPPSLNRLPAGGNTAEDNDMSDAALFSNALR